MTKQVFKTVFAGRDLVVETGQVAKQANGSAVVRYGESTVLTAATMSKKMATGDFFPLQVNYEEKMYAAGKYPGGFNKREGRPSTDATLTARLIDRRFALCLRKGSAMKFRLSIQFFLMTKMLRLKWPLCLVALWLFLSQIFLLTALSQEFKSAM